jgi:hypothetical protein
VVICCHIGTGVKANHASDMSPIDAWITSMPISIANSAADWIWAPMWKKFPDLRMALSEGGIGWIPYLLERADFTHRHHNAWTNSNFDGKMPSDIFNKHFITCFIEDNFGLKNLDYRSTSRWLPGKAITRIPTAPGRTRQKRRGPDCSICQKR